MAWFSGHLSTRVPLRGLGRSVSVHMSMSWSILLFIM